MILLRQWERKFYLLHPTAAVKTTITRIIIPSRLWRAHRALVAAKQGMLEPGDLFFFGQEFLQGIVQVIYVTELYKLSSSRQ